MTDLLLKLCVLLRESIPIREAENIYNNIMGMDEEHLLKCLRKVTIN